MRQRGHHLNLWVQDYFTAVFRRALHSCCGVSPMNSMNSAERAALRRELRDRRRQLSGTQQNEAAQQVCNRLAVNPHYLQAQHIALFIAIDGEVNLQPLQKEAEVAGKICYLPAIDPQNPELLVFRRYHSGDRLVKAGLGVREPEADAPMLASTDLDLVLTPLVGFDAQANRMGMGGGFYDKTFSFKRETPDAPPVLLGVAHECQKLDRIETAWWDVPLDGVMTSLQYYPRS